MYYANSVRVFVSGVCVWGGGVRKLDNTQLEIHFVVATPSSCPLKHNMTTKNT